MGLHNSKYIMLISVAQKITTVSEKRMGKYSIVKLGKSAWLHVCFGELAALEIFLFRVLSQCSFLKLLYL